METEIQLELDGMTHNGICVELVGIVWDRFWDIFRRNDENFISFTIEEVVRNVLDAHAKTLKVRCWESWWYPIVEIIDDGLGIHAKDTWQKKEERWNYWGGRGKWEKIMKRFLPKRWIYTDKQWIRKLLHLPQRVSLWYRRYSWKNGTRTILRLPKS